MTLTYGATTITLPGAIPVGSLPGIERVQNQGEAANGTPRVYDHAVSRWLLKIKVRVNATQLTALRSFVKSTVVFGKYAFTVVPDAGVDFGKGAGTGFTDVRWWSGDLDENPRPGNTHRTITFVLRTHSSTTSDPA